MSERRRTLADLRRLVAEVLACVDRRVDEGASPFGRVGRRIDRRMHEQRPADTQDGDRDDADEQTQQQVPPLKRTPGPAVKDGVVHEHSRQAHKVEDGASDASIRTSNQA